MYYVYVLQSLSSSIYYVGIAKDIELRLKDHNRGKSRFTKGHLPWKLIYSEGPFETQVARDKEKYYKSTSGRVFLKEKGIMD